MWREMEMRFSGLAGNEGIKITVMNKNVLKDEEIGSAILAPLDRIFRADMYDAWVPISLRSGSGSGEVHVRGVLVDPDAKSSTAAAAESGKAMLQAGLGVASGAGAGAGHGGSAPVYPGAAVCWPGCPPRLLFFGC